MPTDDFYDRMYDTEDRVIKNMRDKRKKHCEEKFTPMTLEEKVNFLIKEYTYNYIWKNKRTA